MSDFDYYSRPAAFEKATGLLLRARPERATNLGDHSGDGSLSVLSAGAQRVYERALIDARGLLDQPEPEPEADRDRRMLQSELSHQLFLIDSERQHATDPLFHLELASGGLEELVLKPFAPATERAAAARLRLEGYSAFFASAQETLERPSRVHVLKAMELAEGLHDFVGGVPAALALQAQDGGLPDNLETAAASAAESVRGFRAWLEEELLPRADPCFALGESRFREKLFLQELLQVDIQGLLRMHDEERLRLEARLESTLSACGAGNAAEAFAGLARDTLEAGNLLAAARASLERLVDFLSEHELLSLPENASCEVREMPSFMWGFAGLNCCGPLEKADVPSFYYVSPVRPEWPESRRREHLQSLNRWVLEMVGIHEAYPGHHVQLARQREVPRLVRRMLYSPAFLEGWAHYTEELMLEAGYAKGEPRLELAMLHEALVRLARFRAAVGLHAEEWNMEQAQALFERQAYLQPSWALEEARRGAFDPMYLIYTLGKLFLRELRDKVRGKWKERYSLRAFHDAVLAQGAPPLPLLEEALLSA